MGTVLDLRSRQAATGEWTAPELRQLYALFDRLPADPEREIVFGVTDAGDPWVAVLNGDEEVLLHVARIGGRIVIHASEPDLVAEGPTLSSAAAHFVAAADFDRRTNAQSSQDTIPAHMLLTLAAAYTPPPADLEDLSIPVSGPAPRFTTPLAETAVILAFTPPDDSPMARGAGTPAFEAPPPPAVATEALAPLPADQPPEARPLPTAAPAAVVLSAAPSLQIPEAPVLAASSEAAALYAIGETLVGGAGADTIAGGPGDDVLDGGGAPEGQVDLLDGGAGDDRLILRPETVANGGPGDDTFAITGGAGQGGAFEAFGIVMDFFQSREDRLEFTPGSHVRIVGISSDADILASVRGAGGGMPNAPVISGARVALDLNGDGRADGFVLLGAGRGQGMFFPDLATGGLWRAGGAAEAPTGGPRPAPTNDDMAVFNANVVGLEAQPVAPYGPAPVFTALQIGPGMFGERLAAHPSDLNLSGLLRPEDLVPAPMEAFG